MQIFLLIQGECVGQRKEVAIKLGIIFSLSPRFLLFSKKELS